MFSETVLKAIRGSLFIRKGTLPEGSEMLHGVNQALAVIDEMLRGDAIASVWSIEDVKGLRSECDVQQLSADGEDDGLTWFHCSTHDMDTLSETECEKEGESMIDDELARKVLATVDHNHDASIGINWDVLEDTLSMVSNDN